MLFFFHKFAKNEALHTAGICWKSKNTVLVAPVKFEFAPLPIFSLLVVVHLWLKELTFFPLIWKLKKSSLLTFTPWWKQFFHALAKVNSHLNIIFYVGVNPIRWEHLPSKYVVSLKAKKNTPLVNSTRIHANVIPPFIILSYHQSLLELPILLFLHFVN